MSIPFLGSQAGFGAAFLNPFNVGIAQGIAGVPVFSGIGYRLIVWVATTTVTILFLMWYAARVKQNPTLSPTYVLDQTLRQERSAHVASAQTSDRMTGRHKAVLAIFALSLAAMVIGVVKFDWYIDEIAAFRAARSPVGLARTTERTVITTFGRDFATASTLFRRGSAPGRIGRQMQSWVRFPDGWRVVAAHVSVIPEPG